MQHHLNINVDRNYSISLVKSILAQYYSCICFVVVYRVIGCAQRIFPVSQQQHW